MPANDPARVEELADRLRVVEDVLAVHRRIELDPRRIADLTQTCFSAASELALKNVQALSRIEAELDAAERSLMDLDARTSMSLFRRALAPLPDGAVVTRDMLIHYARLMARHFVASAQSSQRMDLLLTRILVMRDGDEAKILPWQAVESTLWYIVRQPRADGGVRASAVAFLRRAVDQMSDFVALDEFFESGFFLDVSGYKVALRDSLIDPDILYACAFMNSSITNRFGELMVLEGTEEEWLRSKIEGVRAKVEEVFASDFAERPEDVAARVDAQHAERKSAAEQYLATKRAGLGTRIVMSVVAALAIAMGIGLYRQPTRDLNELVAARQESVNGISPLLEKGSFSRGASEPVFVGHVSPTAWDALDANARVLAVRAMAERLEARDVKTALLFEDKAIVAQVVAGRVIYVH